MIKVQTRENSHGRYWCNATVRGYDVSVEAPTVAEAQLKFWREPWVRGVLLEFLPVQPYSKKRAT